ncbi:MAG: ABC transporter permease [Armatimonadota bacterium]|nr:ABC transporter permease [Armatimonadota bacterium]
MSAVPAMAPPREATPRSAARGPARAASVLGGGVLVLVVGAAVFAPLLAPYDPLAPVGAPLSAPDDRFRLGTSALGQDLLSQWLYGARVSLTIGFLTAGCSTLLSATIGVASATWRRGGGWLLGLIDLFLAIPTVPILVLLVAFLGQTTSSLVAALALVGWAAFARIVRAQTIVALRRDHIEASRALGGSGFRLLRFGVWPEILPILFTKFLLTVRWAILLEATLGLLGLGDPTRVSWGTMLHQAFSYPLLFVTDAWLWWAAPPALAIAVTSLGLAAIGQDLDVWLNPHAAPRA